MKKRLSLLSTLLLITVIVMAGCNFIGKTEIQEHDDEIQVVTTIYPLYEFVKEVGGEKVSVHLLLDPGMEAHSFDPTPRDIVSIEKADLFVMIGASMEPWASDVLKGISNEDLKIFEAAKYVELIKSTDHKDEDKDKDEHDGEEDEHEAEEHHHGEYDPHLWLDLTNDQKIISAIAEELTSIDSANKDFYLNKATAYNKKLKDLDNKYKESLKTCEKNMFITGGHNAYAYLAKRYGLTYLAAHGIAPDSEPTPQSIKELVDISKEKGLRYILFEELVSPKVAETLAEEIPGSQTIIFNPIANLTKDQFNNGATFISLMGENLENLKLVLECK